MCICRSTVCKQPHGHRALLNRGKPYHASAVLLQIEVGVELADFLYDLEEELAVHPETASEHLRVLGGIIGEVVGVEDAVPLVPLPGLLLRRPIVDPTRRGPP